TLNQMTLNQMTLNGFVATADSLEALVSQPLVTETFEDAAVDPALRYGLRNADTRMFFKYLVSCALSSEQEPVTYTWTPIPGKPVTYSFAGSLGLCTAWGDGPADEDCQEAVTACLLARNNAYGLSKALSPRGPYPSEGGAATMEQMTEVPAKPTQLSGASVPSFNACKTAQSGAARNCGWDNERSLLGTCTPGKKVTLACEGTGEGSMVTRICDGIEGCESNSLAVRASGEVCTSTTPKLTFVCGNDGAFAAMTGPVSSGQEYTSQFASAVGGSFPATERELFPYREGAFYGNLFNGAARTHDITFTINAAGVATSDFLISGPMTSIDVFGDAFACHDPEWTVGAAYLNDRLCAIAWDTDGEQTKLCVAKPLGRCLFSNAPPAKCANGDAGVVIGDRDFGLCRDLSDTVRPWAFTVMLHQPCDLLPPYLQQDCRRTPIIQ
ncbi:MAG TPA: hypothetical protein VIG06_25665, partial [Kofleriaceae bacterium]